MKISKEETKLLKAISIWIMVAYHVLAIDIANHKTLFHWFWMQFSNYGNICVAIFAFISAYGLSLKIADKQKMNYMNFWFKRVVKLYQSYLPVFFIALIICVIEQIIGFHGSAHWGFSEVYGKGVKSLLHMLINMMGLSHVLYGNCVYTLNQTWWYMSLALLIVIATPIIYSMQKKIKYFAILLCLVVGILSRNEYVEYLLLIAIACVNVEKMSNSECIESRNVKKVLISILVIGIWGWYRKYGNVIYNPIADSIAVIPIIYIMKIIISKLKLKGKAIEIWGENSGNIFYIHSLIYMYWRSRGVIYKLQYGSLILLITMILSLGFSVLLEKFKEKIGWNRIFDKIYSIKI